MLFPRTPLQSHPHQWEHGRYAHCLGSLLLQNLQCSREVGLIHRASYPHCAVMFISMLSFSVYRGGEPSKSQINYAGLFPLLLYFLAKDDFLQSPETIRKKKKRKMRNKWLCAKNWCLFFMFSFERGGSTVGLECVAVSKNQQCLVYGRYSLGI